MHMRNSFHYSDLFKVQTWRSFFKIPSYLSSFLPGIICVLLIYVLFWSVSQAQDLIVAYTEGSIANRLYFFSAFNFFVLSIWYTSRIVVGAKISMKQELPLFYRKH